MSERRECARPPHCSAETDDREGIHVVSTAPVVTRTVEELGGLDIRVNGAAGNFLCLAEQLSPNGFGAVVDIDLKGMFHCSKAALPHLRKNGGVVLNISATLHYPGKAAQARLASTKVGVDALTRVLAVEWGPTAFASTASPPGRSPTPKGYGGYSMMRRSSRPTKRRRCSGSVSSRMSATLRWSCAPTLPPSSPASRSSSTAACGSHQAATSSCPHQRPLQGSRDYPRSDLRFPQRFGGGRTNEDDPGRAPESSTRLTE